MKISIVTLTLLLGLPGFSDQALTAPAPRDGWKDPYKRPGARPAPRATPRAAPRTAPRADPRRARPPANPSPGRPDALPSRTRPLTAPRLPRTVTASPPTRAPARTAPAPATPSTTPIPPLPPTLRADPGPATLYRQLPKRPARLWHLRLTAGSHNLLVRHASLNPLKSDDLLSHGSINGGVEITVLPGLLVGADVGWVGGRFEDTVFGTDTTEVHAHTLRLGARVGYRLWDAVTPYVRGGFAATWLSARIRTDTQSLGGRAFAPGAYGLAGVEFTIRRSWMRRVFRSRVFTMGLYFEAGWVHLGKFKLDGGTNADNLVDDYRAGLGQLTLSGVTVNTGLVLAF